MTLTQKESLLLQDLKSQEQLCIDKYGRYSNLACDPQLKKLLAQLAEHERQHLDTLTQMESGTAPMMGGGQSQTPGGFTESNCAENEKQQDAYLCKDLINTEKHVSSTYNTCVFEFRDKGMRDALNHIQKEEQEHGKFLYDYMAANGMYNTQQA